MAEIIAGVAISHSPLIMTSEEKGGEKGAEVYSKVKGNEGMAGRGWGRCT